MQTFLPYPDFEEVALVLDDKRLGKQRVECMQILNALRNKNSWSNHVVVRMWKGYENCLKAYANTIIIEWECRGFHNNMDLYYFKYPYVLPPWIGENRLHLSHRCNLVRKMPEHYSQFWADVDPEAPYWWPVPLKDAAKQKQIDNYWMERRN